MTGFTKEEKFLAQIGHDSFLQFWSWPNLFRNQGHCKNGGDGKEICDLTIIFGNDFLLFSDKKIFFDDQNDINSAWKRWARKAIRDSVKQINGAKRWFMSHHDRVFIDKHCTVKLPINLPHPKDMIFYSIVVCHGIDKALLDFNSEPSFRIDNTIRENDHWDGDACRPFTIGKISDSGFIHVFNEATIFLILEEFNTAKDFISYLKQRESLLNSEKSVKVKSESDIIQLYYENINEETGSRSILLSPEANKKNVDIDKGGLDRLYTNFNFIAKKEADKVSYFWDDLIQSFSFHALNESTEFKSWEFPSEIEPGLRLIAELGRFERRVLSNSFIEFYQKVLPDQRGTRLSFDPYDKNRVYLFLLLPFRPSFGSNKEYRKIRRQMLEDYCLINKYLNRKLDKIIGIAAKTRDNNIQLDNNFFNEGQDFIFCDTSEWNENDFNYAKEIYDQYINNGLLVKREYFHESVSEFPISTSCMTEFRKKIILKGSDRNKPCFCGSGLKFKNCCGRS